MRKVMIRSIGIMLRSFLRINESIYVLLSGKISLEFGEWSVEFKLGMRN